MSEQAQRQMAEALIDSQTNYVQNAALKEQDEKIEYLEKQSSELMLERDLALRDGDDLRAERDRLRQALNEVLYRYTSLVNSGDAGFWDTEQEPVVMRARSVLFLSGAERSDPIRPELIKERTTCAERLTTVARYLRDLESKMIAANIDMAIENIQAPGFQADLLDSLAASLSPSETEEGG